jgi:hypothetical protein
MLKKVLTSKIYRSSNFSGFELCRVLVKKLETGQCLRAYLSHKNFVRNTPSEAWNTYPIPKIEKESSSLKSPNI